MNIAIAVNGESITSPVAETFEECSNLLIVNVETMEVIIIPNLKKQEDDPGEQIAKSVLQHNCEAVISGLIQSVAFEILAKACVTRFLGIGFNGEKALELMDSNTLELIRDVNGGQNCGGLHHH